MSAIHVAVIGVGSFGRHHVRHLCRHPLVDRVSVVDRDPARACAVAEAHGATVATSAAAADAVVVAVPTEAHYCVASPLLEAGVPVLLEKPIASSDAEAAALIEAADAGRTLLQVGHIERYSPVMSALQRSAGRPRRIVATRHNAPRATPIAADVVLDLMIHDIDLVLALAKAPVVTVEAGARDASGHEAATARLTFADGMIAELSASRLAASVERTITVRDARATWHGDFMALSLTETRDDQSTVHALAAQDNLANELDTFVRAVVFGHRPNVDGEAGAAALAIANRIRAAVHASLKIPA